MTTTQKTPSPIKIRRVANPFGNGRDGFVARCAMHGWYTNPLTKAAAVYEGERHCAECHA